MALAAGGPPRVEGRRLIPAPKRVDSLLGVPMKGTTAAHSNLTFPFPFMAHDALPCAGGDRGAARQRHRGEDNARAVVRVPVGPRLRGWGGPARPRGHPSSSPLSRLSPPLLVGELALAIAGLAVVAVAGCGVGGGGLAAPGEAARCTTGGAAAPRGGTRRGEGEGPA